MATDPTEEARRAMLAAGVRPLEGSPTWTTEQLGQEYEVLGFKAPFVVVVRKSDGKKGSLQFTHDPRSYFNWEPSD